MILRIATNRDICQRLLLNSDPLLSLSRIEKNKKHRKLTEDMIQLIFMQDEDSEEDDSFSETEQRLIFQKMKRISIFCI